MYDIRNVGYEFILAEKMYNEGDLENAAKHYQSAIDNYNNADNEYLLSPDSPYTITEMGKTISIPSVNDMVDKSYDRLRKIKSKNKKMIQHIDSIINEHKFEGRKKLLELIESGNKDLVFERLSHHADNHHSPLLFYDVMAWLYDRIGEKDKAVEYYQKIYDVHPMKEVLCEIFNVYFSAERYEEALKVADKYIEDYGEGKILRTKTLLRLSTPEEGLRIIDEALDEIETYNNKFAEQALAHRAAVICYDKKQYKKALYYVDRAISSCKVGTAKDSRELKEKIENQINNKNMNTPLSHEELVSAYVKAWNELDASIIEPLLADDFTYGSMWVMTDLKGKTAYMDYISGKFATIKRTGSVVEAKIGVSPQTGLARLEMLQDGHRCAKIDVKSENGKMTSAYMHDL